MALGGYPILFHGYPILLLQFHGTLIVGPYEFINGQESAQKQPDPLQTTNWFLYIIDRPSANKKRTDTTTLMGAIYNNDDIEWGLSRLIVIRYGDGIIYIEYEMWTGVLPNNTLLYLGLCEAFNKQIFANQYRCHLTMEREREIYVSRVRFASENFSSGKLHNVVLYHYKCFWTLTSALSLTFRILRCHHSLKTFDLSVYIHFVKVIWKTYYGHWRVSRSIMYLPTFSMSVLKSSCRNCFWYKEMECKNVIMHGIYHWYGESWQ